MLEKAPKQAVVIVIDRILDSEASLGEKLFLVEVIGNSAAMIAEGSVEEASLKPY